MRYRNPVVAAASLAATAALLAACSHATPSIGQYAMVTGQGPFSTQEIKHVAAPGEQIKIGGSDQAWYVPANFRNYVTAPRTGDANITPDRTTPQTVTTGQGSGGKAGMPVRVYTYVGFELNPAIVRKVNGHYDLAFAKAFFPFCFKFGCASQEAQDTSNNESLLRSSSPGWLHMLDEVFPTAIDNATQSAVSTYGPDLWTDKAEWPKLADKLAANVQAEWEKLTSSPASMPFFCGTGSTTTRCTLPLVQVRNVVPDDPDVIRAYNQQVSSQYQVNGAAARHDAAARLYGQDAGWFLGMRDLVDECGRVHVQCTIYAGNAPSHP